MRKGLPYPARGEDEFVVFQEAITAETARNLKREASKPLPIRAFLSLLSQLCWAAGDRF